MNGFLLQWLVDYSSFGVAVPNFTDGVVYGTVPVEVRSCMEHVRGGGNAETEFEATVHGDGVAEPRPGMASIVAACVEDAAGSGGFENLRCGGCWEILPEVCGCGSLQLCLHCSSGLRDVVVEAAVDEEDSRVSLVHVQREMQTSMANMHGLNGLLDSMGGLVEELRTMRANMVGREEYSRLTSRLDRIEGGVPEDEGDHDDFWSRRYADYDEYGSDYTGNTRCE